jgi:hypothetical protein
MITRLDSYVGRMLDQLELLGLAENTLVIFTSDNGPHNESKHDLDRFDPNGPYTGIKRSLTDGGIRVPFIAWWPGTVKPARVGSHRLLPRLAAHRHRTRRRRSAGESRRHQPRPASHRQSRIQQKKHEFLYWEFHEGGFKQAAFIKAAGKASASGGPDAPVKLLTSRTTSPRKPTSPDSILTSPPRSANISKPRGRRFAEWEPRWKAAGKGK